MLLVVILSFVAVLVNCSIRIVADSRVDAIYLNGVRQTFSFSSGLNYTTQGPAGNFNATLKSGDVVAITAYKQGNISATNPAGILAEIDFVYSNGTSSITISTGSGYWFCTNMSTLDKFTNYTGYYAPFTFGANDNKTTYWQLAAQGPMLGIANTTQWIWAMPITSSNITCKITLPGPTNSTITPTPVPTTTSSATTTQAPSIPTKVITDVTNCSILTSQGIINLLSLSNQHYQVSNYIDSTHSYTYTFEVCRVSSSVSGCPYSASGFQYDSVYNGCYPLSTSQSNNLTLELIHFE
jgi:hypothetical protein